MITIRSLHERDIDRVREILTATQMFREEEIKVAIDVIEEYLDEKDTSDYWTYVAAEEDDKAVGFMIVGPNPITIGTYDLYWIAVDMDLQRRGTGTKLLAFAERKVTERGGRLLIAETSSRPSYLRTRNFYKHNGYSELAQIRDFYDVGDDLIIYGKYLKEV
jgi:ribosomal protein S18 acetylase RimI-like enzyme